MKSVKHQAYAASEVDPDPKCKCPCGGSYRKHGFNMHIKTRRHLNYLNPKMIVVEPRPFRTLPIPESEVEWVIPTDAKVKPPPLC